METAGTVSSKFAYAFPPNNSRTIVIEFQSKCEMTKKKKRWEGGQISGGKTEFCLKENYWILLFFGQSTVR